MKSSAKKIVAAKTDGASETKPPRAPFDWRGWLIPAVGGIAGALAFVPVGWWFLAPLAPLALFITLKNAPTTKSAFRRVLFGSWIFYFGAIQWLLTIRVYAPLEILGVLGIVMLALYMALWIAVPMWAVRRWLWPNSAGMQLAAFGSVWLISEWCRTLGRLANPLGLIGHSWAQQAELIQIAEWLGELGVTFEILAVGGLIVYWAHALKTKATRRPVYLAAACSVVLVFVVAFLAVVRLMTVTPPHSAKPHINVAIIQPYVEQDAKLNAYLNPDETIRRSLSGQIAELNRQLVMQNRTPDWQLVVMPETAYTEMDFFTNEPLKKKVGQLARDAKVDILFGADRDMKPLGGKEIYNSAYLARPDSSLDKMVYDKMRLVPFGEALPYFDMIPGFQESIVGIGSFNEGKTPGLFESHGMTFGVMICFESTFSQMGRMLANQGADVLAVITNDAWYRMSAGPQAHFNLSLLRAVETRRWIVRAANTGISAIITPAGTVQKSLALGARGVITGTIPKSDGARATFFMRWGNTWLIGAAWATLLAALCARLRKKTNAA